MDENDLKNLKELIVQIHSLKLLTVFGIKPDALRKTIEKLVLASSAAKMSDIWTIYLELLLYTLRLGRLLNSLESKKGKSKRRFIEEVMEMDK